MTDPKISVICFTYNHEKYVAEMLDGILSQQIDVPIEILIHDDASTDGTADILRDCDRRYPGRLTLICQSENQHSKGPGRVFLPTLLRGRGEYIAVCEGDDRWIDPLKLQKQYDALESHPELDMCAHTVNLVRSGQRTIRKPKQRTDTIFPAEKVITGGGGFVGSCSLFFRSSLIAPPPKFYEAFQIDYSLQILGSLRGGLLFLKDVMGEYRYQLPGAWTANIPRQPERYLKLTRRLCDLLMMVNEETDGTYLAAIHLALYQYYRRMVKLAPNDTEIAAEMDRLYRELTFPQRWNLVKKDTYLVLASRVKSFLKKVHLR